MAAFTGQAFRRSVPCFLKEVPAVRPLGRSQAPGFPPGRPPRPLAVPPFRVGLSANRLIPCGGGSLGGKTRFRGLRLPANLAALLPGRSLAWRHSPGQTAFGRKNRVGQPPEVELRHSGASPRVKILRPRQGRSRPRPVLRTLDPVRVTKTTEMTWKR